MGKKLSSSRTCTAHVHISLQLVGLSRRLIGPGFSVHMKSDAIRKVSGSAVLFCTCTRSRPAYKTDTFSIISPIPWKSWKGHVGAFYRVQCTRWGLVFPTCGEKRSFFKENAWCRGNIVCFEKWTKSSAAVCNIQCLLRP